MRFRFASKRCISESQGRKRREAGGRPWRTSPALRLVDDPEPGHLPPERRRRDAEHVSGAFPAPLALTQGPFDRLSLGGIDHVGEGPTLFVPGSRFGGLRG